MEDTVFTIGHSDRSLGDFIHLLKTAGITAIADVRSSPYSRIHEQFNRDTLTKALQHEHIKYVFLGKELGARPKERECYRDGIAEYSLIAKTEAFSQGLARVIDGTRRYKVAIMCAEKEPLDCHRTILVARNLIQRGVQVRHILEDGKTECHSDTESRLLKLTNQETGDLFGADSIELAYEIRGRTICYREKEAELGEVEK